jgi:exopolyphosphatase/pppGpp-phosphohydrolase
MDTQNPPVCAAIDLGSNTIRMVVARCWPTTLDVRATDEAVVRLSESVNTNGMISQEKCDQTIAVLHRLKNLAQAYDAHPLLAVATEAVRRATNKDVFLSSLQRETGLVVHPIESETEARLTFYGATSELASENGVPAHIAIVDLGGGSMELIFVKDLQICWQTSLALGSGWLLDRYLHSDPPTTKEVAIARLFLHASFQDLQIKHFPPFWIATGGSANSLLLLAQQAFGLSTEHQILSRESVIRCEELLFSLPAEEIAQRYQLEAKRVRILHAGVAIIHALMECFELDKLRISPQGIREGILLAYARFGEDWLLEAQRTNMTREQSDSEHQ